MGNVPSEMKQNEKQKMSKESFYRIFGLRMVNEGDGYAIDGERLKIQREQQLQMPQQQQQQPEDKQQQSEFELGNPGAIADLHHQCHEMWPQTFEGFRLNISRTLSQSLAVGHALQVGQKSQLADCQFNASFVGERMHPMTGETYPAIMGEVDAKGNVRATLMHFMAARWRCKWMANVLDGELQNTRLFVDYFGKSCTCSWVLSNLDVRHQMGVCVASYLQQVTPQLALGVDLIYQREQIVPGGQAALVSAVARYHHDDNRLWSAVFSLHSLELCYSQLYGQCLGASVQLRANILKRQAISRLCYHCFIPKMGFNFRGGIDTRGVISALCERRLEPLPIVLQLSGKLNHRTNRFRFGLGLLIG
ncbi:mitochondrial import receptor subunit TOM40 homolog 2-like [Drosophila nasuta]|uniref:mitochondrial import receptor subunit TOM40 homolog 2-like n=1 Tax=Drosophila nasuta TaxID=42062 RepID=UPI00295EE9A5|nr:mitochondrial import receptor subunit TOM40 homolog 2-like [Drosophila nasuta]XP_060664365.1 mitochondrial import receptor subunit TOM40 homolog 2-like [Drosophila nasuta]XP_060664366.1 mitochondrial import receptor subunit TOM40 homolog 2-like [Drosophila nasuta]